jgi:hypothetical protein
MTQAIMAADFHLTAATIVPVEEQLWSIALLLYFE